VGAQEGDGLLAPAELVDGDGAHGTSGARPANSGYALNLPACLPACLPCKTTTIAPPEDKKLL